MVDTRGTTLTRVSAAYYRAFRSSSPTVPSRLPVLGLWSGSPHRPCFLCWVPYYSSPAVKRQRHLPISALYPQTSFYPWSSPKTSLKPPRFPPPRGSGRLLRRRFPLPTETKSPTRESSPQLPS
ncbi:Uncharacterized protein HZ326_8229 [Fusarium oxysporum f. sp. albedinis]|nr:Uncharacterized protein HZ326_8229 [Fusarium oxysporum f. sp. albedinis]